MQCPQRAHADGETARIEALKLKGPTSHERNAWKETYFSQVMLDAHFNIASLDKEYVRHAGGIALLTVPPLGG